MKPVVNLRDPGLGRLAATAFYVIFAACSSSSSFSKLGAQYSLGAGQSKSSGWAVEVLRVQEESKTGALLQDKRAVQVGLRIKNTTERWRSFRFQSVPVSSSNFVYLLHADKSFKAGYEKEPGQFDVEDLIKNKSGLVLGLLTASPDSIDPVFWHPEKGPIAYPLGGDCEWNYYEVYCKAFSKWLAPGQTTETTVRFLLPDGATPSRISIEGSFEQEIGPLAKPTGKN